MKRTILALIPVLALLQACYVTRYVPAGGYRLSAIISPDGQRHDPGRYGWKDTVVGLMAEITPSFVAVHVANHTRKEMTVRWDLALYTDHYGKTHHAMHVDRLATTEEETRLPETLAPSQVSEGVVTMEGKARYRQEWMFEPLVIFSENYTTEEQARQHFSRFGPVRLSVPLETAEGLMGYTLEFTPGELTVEKIKLYER